MRRTRSGGCALAASGHAIDAPPRKAMNARLCMLPFPGASGHVMRLKPSTADGRSTSRRPSSEALSIDLETDLLDDRLPQRNVVGEDALPMVRARRGHRLHGGFLQDVLEGRIGQ